MQLGVYLRVGSATRRATEPYIEELMRENARISFDEEPIIEADTTLDPELLEDIFDGKPSQKKLLSKTIIVQSKAEQSQYYPTVAGLLHFYSSPERYLPEASILCTRFSDVHGRNIIQTEEITGTIAEQAQLAQSLIKSWMRRDFHLAGSKLKGRLPVPEAAIRESIINALIHRKYFIPGAIKLALYDNRFEVFSPGSFPGLVNIGKLGDGITFLRNPHIARIARKLGLAEKLGSGIKLIFESCDKYGIVRPEYFEDGDFVKLVFFFTRTKNPTKNDEELLLDLLNEKHEISMSDAINLLSVSRNTATRKLNKLIEKDKVIRRGKGMSVRYYLKQ